MFSFSSALCLAAALVTAGASVYNPLASCYSNGLLLKCDHKVSCEPRFAHLQCPRGCLLRIHEADYGRHDYSTCSVGRSHCQVQNVHCTSPGLTYRVAQSCNGRNSCYVRASSSVYGDPCPGTSKYLQVSYFCERQQAICEGRTAHLRCNGGKRIRVHAADYGRRDPRICSAGRPRNQLRNTYCTSSTPTYNLGRICNGRTSCSVRVSNALFGDPCPGTYKYLQVSFYCV